MRETLSRGAAVMAAAIVTTVAVPPGAAAADDGTGELSYRTVGWGANAYGQVGSGVVQAQHGTPVEVTGWPQSRYSQVATGETHSLGIGPNRILQSWGGNACGQLGTAGGSRSTPEPVHGAPSNLYGVAAGRDFSLALTGTGRVYAWGCNDKGQLGLGTVGGPVRSPALVPGLEGVVQLSAGYDHALALTWDGKVYAWGLNDDGEVGDGTPVPRPAPVRVSGLTEIRAVAAGIHHSLAVSNDDKLLAWGRNAAGQLGTGPPYQDRLTPVQVPVPARVQNVAAGGHHSLALTVNRRVYAFGDNSYGQLGLGDQVNRGTPTLIPSLGVVHNVSAGVDFSLAQTPPPFVSGKLCVHTWGRNNTGQLGTGGTAPADPLPKLVYHAADEPPLLMVGAVAGSSSRHALATQVTAWWINP
ncbi:hypothetical protein DPM19_22900 [Actinomadura craniellae]|uniref:RCC1-like domain-containing protein n=1 Tax=Actinomadura craniellae TaxID=2231787 RepID=A0A365H1F7_9ACTN|nr:hypothetical protein [Actinomadura craniellae]RAY12868.1 hypothetical protein DPM19_22900 [Actinomadura craniellae]